MAKKNNATQNGLFKTQVYTHQKEVINFLRANNISIVIGEAGTAKDYCCLYRGLDAIDSKEHSELVLIKPIVELGNKMGYLPGDEEDKMQPYEKSFHNNIVKMIGKTMYTKLKKNIRFEAINFMRGDTFEYSTVILSEAQNCTLHELISVVTRVASNSKIFINGDPLQSDIGRKSGLRDFIKIVENVKGVGVMELGEEHQVRNPMIVDINRKYREHLNGKLQVQNNSYRIQAV
jgi:phosphate starvation-inducible protein PhoH and related proteins